MLSSFISQLAVNKAIENRPQKTWAGLTNARLLLRHYVNTWIYYEAV